MTSGSGMVEEKVHVRRRKVMRGGVPQGKMPPVLLANPERARTLGGEGAT